MNDNQKEREDKKTNQESLFEGILRDFDNYTKRSLKELGIDGSLDPVIPIPYQILKH